jgi:hypothetical protein
VAKLPPDEGGFHLDKKNQPYAEVIGTPDSNDWTLDASHEIVEMLVDPMGNRLQSSQAIEISGEGSMTLRANVTTLWKHAIPVRGTTVHTV